MLITNDSDDDLFYCKEHSEGCWIHLRLGGHWPLIMAHRRNGVIYYIFALLIGPQPVTSWLLGWESRS